MWMLGNLSPMPNDVGKEQVEKMRETFPTYFVHVLAFLSWPSALIQDHGRGLFLSLFEPDPLSPLDQCESWAL